MEGHAAPVARDLRADLDQLLAQAGQRLRRLRHRQRPHKIAEVVCERLPPAPTPAGQPTSPYADDSEGPLRPAQARCGLRGKRRASMALSVPMLPYAGEITPWTVRLRVRNLKNDKPALNARVTTAIPA
jgi:hypothetical protein